MILSQKHLTILLIAFLAFLAGAQIFAAEISLEPTRGALLKIGDEFTTHISINTNDKEINAVEGSINFPGNLIGVKKISDASSIISLWIENPQISRDGQIRFAGVIPGGYSGAAGHLFSISFEVLREGRGAIEVKDILMFLNDGMGTSVDSFHGPFYFEAKTEDVPLVEKKAPVVFIGPPESFTPQIAKDNNVFEGKWFVVFTTQDKASGMSHYAVYESRRRVNESQIKEGDWIISESPHVLNDQSLKSYIYIKAVNNDGKERVEMIMPRKETAKTSSIFFWALALFLMLLGVYLLKKQNESKKD